MPSHNDDAVGRVLEDRYRLTRLLGAGASARVYAAEDVELRRRVAIKLLHPGLAGDQAFQRRFLAEARAVAALRHPHILRLYDWGEDRGSPYLVTELLEGGSLLSLLDAHHLLTPSQATAVGHAAASALDHAHRRGLVHRDIKPANLLFDDEGRASVADFGLARALAEATLTEPSGAIVGTARYAAPEQVEGRSLDGKADVYALALVLTEATTGTVPFATDTPLGTLMARLAHPLSVPEGVGPLAAVLEEAGRVDPDDRPDAAALALALERLARRLPPPAPLPRTGPLVDGRATSDHHPTSIPGGPARTAWQAPTVLADEETRLAARLAAPGSAPPPGVWPAPTPPPVDPTPLPSAPVASPPVAPPPDLAPTTALAPATVVAVDDRWPAPEPPPAVPGPATPRRRRLIPLAVVVAVLLVAGGVVGAILATRPPPMVPVPSLHGDTRATATRTLADHRLILAVAGRTYDATAPAGTVISQTPSNGRIREHQTVAVTLSLGPQPVKVPDLSGDTRDVATKVLTTRGLTVGRVRHRTSITIPAGQVITWSPRTGALLPGRPVDLVVSSGKPSITVPLLQGPAVMGYAAAAAVLRAAHFTPTEELVYSNVVTPGEVVTTSPAPKTSALYGSTVTVEVSKGPDYTYVPTDLVGETVAQAAAELQADGFGVSGVTGNPNGKVRSSSPPPGSKVIVGSSIQLITK